MKPHESEHVAAAQQRAMELAEKARQSESSVSDVVSRLQRAGFSGMKTNAPASHLRDDGRCAGCWCYPALPRVMSTYRGLWPETDQQVARRLRCSVLRIPPETPRRLVANGPVYRSYCHCSCHGGKYADNDDGRR